MAGYDSPFRKLELVGVYRWDEDLTESLQDWSPWLYHACHQEQYQAFQRRNKLFLSSGFEVKGGHDETNLFECVWASIQPWHRTHGHNHFGPFLIKMPLSRLNGRRFYVFKRVLGKWTHYYFVQRENKSPLFGKGRGAELISPSSLFKKAGSRGALTERLGIQYEIVLTEPVPLCDAKFVAINHRRCARTRCKGMLKNASRKILRAAVDAELTKIANRFPQFKSRILAATE